MTRRFRQRTHKALQAALIQDRTPEWVPTMMLESHLTPEIKRRAAAEWAAMDDRGQLPEGWTYQEQQS